MTDRSSCICGPFVPNMEHCDECVIGRLLSNEVKDRAAFALAETELADMGRAPTGWALADAARARRREVNIVLSAVAAMLVEPDRGDSEGE